MFVVEQFFHLQRNPGALAESARHTLEQWKCPLEVKIWGKREEKPFNFRKSVKAALMLIPLLGIPNIMQTIPFSPTQGNPFPLLHPILPIPENITYFAIWTYCASFTYMYQGVMIGEHLWIECITGKSNCFSHYLLLHQPRSAGRPQAAIPAVSASPLPGTGPPPWGLTLYPNCIALHPNPEQ